MNRCIGITKKKERCSRKAVINGFCTQHKKVENNKIIFPLIPDLRNILLLYTGPREYKLLQKIYPEEFTGNFSKYLFEYQKNYTKRFDKVIKSKTNDFKKHIDAKIYEKAYQIYKNIIEKKIEESEDDHLHFSINIGEIISSLISKYDKNENFEKNLKIIPRMSRHKKEFYNDICSKFLTNNFRILDIFMYKSEFFNVTDLHHDSIEEFDHLCFEGNFLNNIYNISTDLQVRIRYTYYNNNFCIFYEDKKIVDFPDETTWTPFFFCIKNLVEQSMKLFKILTKKKIVNQIEEEKERNKREKIEIEEIKDLSLLFG